MATTIKELAGTALTSIITTGLNSLASAARAASSAGAIDNTSGLDFLIDLQLTVQYTSSAPAAGVIAADVYLVPSLDGTNYAEGSSSLTPQGALYVGSFESRNGSTSAVERLTLTGIPIGPYKYTAVLVNQSGKTLAASGNILAYATSKVQSV